MLYVDAVALLSRPSTRNRRRKIARNTWLVGNPDGPLNGTPIIVQLHQTAIVVLLPNGHYTLHSGGWQTRTTKERIERFSPARITSCRTGWYVTVGGFVADDGTVSQSESWVFRDGIEIDAAGRPYTDGTVELVKRAGRAKRAKTPRAIADPSTAAWCRLRDGSDQGRELCERWNKLVDWVAALGSHTPAFAWWRDCTSAKAFSVAVIAATNVRAKRRALVAALAYIDGIRATDWQRAAAIWWRLTAGATSATDAGVAVT